MGFLEKLKGVFRRDIPAGAAPVITASTSQINATTTDYLVRTNLDKIEPAIRQGFEKWGTMLIDEMRASERRTKKELIEYFDMKITATPGLPGGRVNKEDVLAEFERAGVIRVRDLTAKFKTSTNAMVNHLNALILEGHIERAAKGKYQKIERDIKATPEVHGEVAKNIKGVEQANSVEQGLKHLFKSV